MIKPISALLLLLSLSSALAFVPRPQSTHSRLGVSFLDGETFKPFDFLQSIPVVLPVEKTTKPIVPPTLVASDAPPFTESVARSAIKALGWRLVAAAITFVSTLQHSSSLHMAFQVVGADFLTKAGTMFVGERLFNRRPVRNGAQRSLVKAAVWRLIAICQSLAFCAFISRDWSLAGKIASTDALFKTTLMVVYERLWMRIGWGKQYQVVQDESASWTNATATVAYA